MASTTATVHATNPFWNRWHPQHDTTIINTSSTVGGHGDDRSKPSTKERTWKASRSRTRTQSVETVQSLPSRSEDWVCRKEEEAHQPRGEGSNPDHHQSNSSGNPHEPNLLQWLETNCPGDCLPKVLAFCGPQQTAALSRTNTHWNETIRAESTWRVLCEELYKWKPGDKEPISWFDLYRNSPCVPIDYSTIPKALQIATTTDLPRRRSAQHHPQQVRSVRVLLRPGHYVLKQAIQVLAAPGVVVSLETVQLPKNRYLGAGPPAALVHPPIAERIERGPEQALPLGVSPPRVARTLEVHLQQQVPTANNDNHSNKPSFRNLFRCHRQPAHDPDASVTDDLTEYEDSSWLPQDGLLQNHQPTAEHATLVVRSRRHNEPAFRVQQGVLRLKHIEIQHNSHGLDIWNGNAAVQIQPLQPPPPSDEPPLPTSAARPTAVLEHCLITSQSGRGIVNIDGGKLIARHVAVVDCAATGIYVGGPGSWAHLESVDVIRNGVGKHAAVGGRGGGRGIARGHSGIYLEQGVARIHNCNISQNSLSGVSVVSPDHAVLHLQRSSLSANGTHQLELPPNGTTSRQRSQVGTDNTLSSNNTDNDDAAEEPSLRSGWLIQAPPSTLSLSLPRVPPPIARAW